MTYRGNMLIIGGGNPLATNPLHILKVDSCKVDALDFKMADETQEWRGHSCFADNNRVVICGIISNPNGCYRYLILSYIILYHL